MRRMLQNSMFAALLAALLQAPAAAAQGQDVDFAPAKEAISKLKQLPGAVQGVQGAVKGTNFGPFNLSGSCGYKCFIGICLYDFNWRWSPDFSWLKSDLVNRYNQVGIISSQFPAHFAPVREWLVVTLPQFSQQFDEAAARLAKAEAVVTDPKATPAQIAAAKQEIVQLLDQLNARLQQGADQLRGAVSSLSGFNQQLTGSMNQVENARLDMERMVSGAQSYLNKEAGGWPCGAGDVQGQYNNVQQTVRGQYDNVVKVAQATGITASQADQSVSLILGTVLNLRTRYQGVLDKLHAAQVTPAGAVQELRLNVAAAAWRDLASYARQQLQ